MGARRDQGFRLSHAFGQAVMVRSRWLSLNRQAGSSSANSGWLAANSIAASAGLSDAHSGRPCGASWTRPMIPSVATR